ncbi:MAG: hypothetical protein S4CHLAM20_13090 [Chlamydiia bacterium]|nr:hypothetical protein [Chlamydiia bacterium]
MEFVNKNKIKKYAYYTLGVGLLLVGAAQMSPADKARNQSDSATKETHVMKSPLKKSRTDANMASDHQKAYDSLSPKSKTVFHTLNASDKQRVVNAHKNGDDPHDELSDIIQEDANSKPKPRDTTSPATKSIRQHDRNQSKQNIYD